MAVLARPLCRVAELGCIPFREAWDLQERLAGAIARGEEPPTLLLLEHPHTFTIGRRGRAENVLWDEAACLERHVEVHRVDRGGDVTYHGPGQLVGYPLMPLGRLDSSGRLPRADYVGFVRRLERVLTAALARLGLPSGEIPGRTGVWVQPDVAARCRSCPPAARRMAAKVAAIGVKVDAAGISRHGFALNVAPDMDYWDGILACGLPDAPAVSLAQLLEPVPPMARVRSEVRRAFGEVFELRLTEAPAPAGLAATGA